MSGRKRSRGGARATASDGTAARNADRLLRNKISGRRPQFYMEGLDSDSDEEGGRQNFSLEDKLASTKFPVYARFFVKELTGEEVNVAYFQRTSFNTPILVREKSGLGMTIPSQEFSVADVKNLVGSRRMVDVMDCKTQKNCQMSMKEWEDYYSGVADGERKRQLNVISLEFSSTKMENIVSGPLVVRQLDWTDHVWPRHLKEQQFEETNDVTKMRYPKVQKYCLMSVKGCYTDFHIDFGGTSVWYHLLKGKKIFWLIPPTETNLKAYEQWTLSGRQGDVFFGDLVEKCGMITLEAGNTFFIPSGWIHAVYTPEDSLVFGGNFLHSYAIEKQIRVAQIEEVTKVPQKFRFPFFTELQWYALDKYVFALLGRTNMDFDDESRRNLLGSEQEQRSHADSLDGQYITPTELFGLKAIVMYIHALPVSKKNLPPPLKTPVNLVRDVRLVVNAHKEDTLEQAVTGRPLLFWPGFKDARHAKSGKANRKTNRDALETSSSAGKDVKTERVPCKVCQPCIRLDCGKCPHCEDMYKFGGSGRLRKACQRRTCVQPLLPLAVCCNVCGLDGWYAETNMRLVDRPPGTCALMECAVCKEVTHPSCLTDYGVDGYIKMDLPNSWECPRCVKVKEETKDQVDAKVAKLEQPEDPLRRKVSSGSDANTAGSYQLFSVKGMSDQPKSCLRAQLSEQIMAASSRPLKDPQYVFRPPPTKLSAKDVFERREKYQKHETSQTRCDDVDDVVEPVDLRFEPLIMLPIFQRLDTTSLSSCAIVCKSWSRIVQDPSLWNTVKLRSRKITSHLLTLIVQRQPEKLYLDCSQVSKQQLTWLLPRIPQTRVMSLVGLDFVSAVISLATVNTPMLQELDLSFVTSLNDSAVYKLLLSPRDSRPGLLDKKSRLKRLKKLYLGGTEISDVSLRYISQFLDHLSLLNVSGCWKISNDGLAQLAMPSTKVAQNLQTIDLSGCRQITDAGLQSLSKCENLSYVDCTETKVSNEAIRKFIDDSSQKLKVSGTSVICKRLSVLKKEHAESGKS